MQTHFRGHVGFWLRVDQMSEVTRLLAEISDGDEASVADLLPLVYDELRRLAAARLAQEPLQLVASSGATSLVHEAYLRLVGPNDEVAFANRRHFFSAAAEAMRRILIDRARKRKAVKHGGGKKQLNLEMLELSAPFAEGRDDELVALDEALQELRGHDEQAAELVKLRFFGGLQHQEAAEVLGLTRRQADGVWALARTWLFRRMSAEDQ